MPAPLQIWFGTDGWRGVIARDFTFDAVRLVARAVADTVRAIHPDHLRPLLAVGYDTRFLSRRFAEVAAEAVAAEGLNVCLTTSSLPTPVLAWSVPLLGAQGGLMVTASHNPPSYNGLKVRTDDGGPATLGITQQIERAVRRLAGDPLADHEAVSSRKGQLAGAAIEPFDPLPRYRDRLRTLVNMDGVARSRLRVVIDGMYGASQGMKTGILREIN